jgi:RNA polymerase sigma-70 factor (ECF subfamily)
MTTNIYNEITNQLIDSNKDAFEQVFRLLYAPLVKFSQKYTKDKSAACDVVQEAFINVWKIRENLTQNQSIKTYMYRSVRNLSLNYIRDRSRVASGLETKKLVSVDSQHLNIHNQSAKDARLRLVKKWINMLPDRQKSVLELSRFEGLSHEEIAEVLQISKRTVNNHIVAAMKNMKRYYDENTE